MNFQKYASITQWEFEIQKKKKRKNGTNNLLKWTTFFQNFYKKKKNIFPKWNTRMSLTEELPRITNTKLIFIAGD